MTDLAIIGYIAFLLILIMRLLDNLPAFKQYISWFFHQQTIDLKSRYGGLAVITGATDGIGKAYSLELAKRGINVVIIARNREKLETVAQEIRDKYNVEVQIIVADFSKGKEIYENLRNELSKLNVGILVNNVGIQYEYPMAIADLPDKEVWDNLNVNMASTVMMTKIVLPQLMANKKGAIVNISSAASHTPQPYMNLYAASKAYCTFFSEALRWEVEKHNITVQTLVPAYISSKINHFQPDIQKVGVLIPDVDTFVRSAINCLGVIDMSTGYWSHRILMFVFLLVPRFIRTKLIGERYKGYNEEYLQKLKKGEDAKSK